MPCQHEKDEFISPVFTTPKKDGTSRMILNLKGLNKFVQYCHFKMESFSTVVNMVKPNCYMASIDLKDAYYSVPIASVDQKYLKFQWQGQLYKLTCFPNGLALCPRKFTKLLKPAYSHLRKLGHLSVSHIDDSYLQGDDYADCANNVLATLRLFDLLGFTCHPDKSSLVPKQQITFLGFVIDSVAMKVYPTREKIDKLKRVCQGLLCCPQPIIREVASVLGFLISIFPAAQFGPLHFRHLDMDKTEALLANKGNFDKRMVLSNAAKADLQWWVNSAENLCKPILSTKPEVTLYTDASKIGWGGVLDNIRIGGQWTPSEADNHINYLEMLAVSFALKAFAHTLVGKHVCIRIDNMTAVADIGKMGTSHSRKRNQLTQCIWHWCLENRVFITTAHIPGKDNQLADAESRKCRKALEWALDTQVFNTGIQKLAVLPEIDLFASRLNYKIKPFVAYQPDPEAQSIDAFTVNWQHYLFYAFPPFSIIPQVLQKIQEEQSTGILVVPNWPTQPWWPQIMRMVIQAPIILPNNKSTIYLPMQPDLVHPLYPRLTLLMCNLSGNPLKVKAFRQTLFPSSCHHGEQAPRNSTYHISGNGNSTVVQGKLINFHVL